MSHLIITYKKSNTKEVLFVSQDFIEGVNEAHRILSKTFDTGISISPVIYSNKNNIVNITEPNYLTVDKFLSNGGIGMFFFGIYIRKYLIFIKIISNELNVIISESDDFVKGIANLLHWFNKKSAAYILVRLSSNS